MCGAINAEEYLHDVGGGPVAALDREHGRLAVEEQARDVDARAHEAARVVAQVQHQRLAAAPLQRGGT